MNDGTYQNDPQSYVQMKLFWARHTSTRGSRKWKSEHRSFVGGPRRLSAARKHQSPEFASPVTAPYKTAARSAGTFL
jgi:hypothetical protein